MNDKVKPFKVPQEIQAALELLLRHGRNDYGCARRCAMFLLSLMIRLYQYLYASNKQLDSLVAEDQIKPVIAAWAAALSTP